MVDDALHATRTAAKEVVPAAAWPSSAPRRRSWRRPGGRKTDDEKQGYQIITKAVESCAYTITENAGYDGDVVVEKVKEGGKGGDAFGFNTATGEYVDLVKAGIIDPGPGRQDGPHQRRVRLRPDAHHRRAHHRPQG